MQGKKCQRKGRRWDKERKEAKGRSGCDREKGKEREKKR